MSHKRIVKLQKNILMMIRAEVRKTLGAQPKSIRKYYEAYKREFRGKASPSSRAELIGQAQRSHIILIGDYHTFSQSQRSALRLMEDLRKAECPLALGVELVRSSDQPLVDRFLGGEVAESLFLEKLDYSRRWGFPWRNFQPLFSFAKDHKVPVIALNAETEDLDARDEHAAKILARYSRDNPSTRLVALYGDLHLARGHIPKKLLGEMRGLGVQRKIITVFQNSESLYWRLASRKQEHAVDVLKLSADRYCIISAAPWVKLQSYLQWAESGVLLEDKDGGADGPGFQELTHQQAKLLAGTLQIGLGRDLEFSVRTVGDLAFLSGAHQLAKLRRDELKAVKAHILGNRVVFIPQTKSSEHMVYLPSESVNSICEAASVLLHAAASGTRDILFDPGQHFFQSVLRSAIAYFGSKALNHKRKCDLEEDHRLLARRKLPASALRQERLGKAVSKAVLAHCAAQRKLLKKSRRGYRALPLPKGMAQGPHRLALFLELTRCLGFILGERLFSAFAAGTLKLPRVQELYALRLDGDAASKKLAKEKYLELLRELERSPLAHASKEESF